jgi:hypothetical protein
VLLVWSSPDAWHQRFRARTSELWAIDADRVWCPSIRHICCPVSCFGSSLYCVRWASNASVAASVAESVAYEIDCWFFQLSIKHGFQSLLLRISESVAPESAGIWSPTTLLVSGAYK